MYYIVFCRVVLVMNHSGIAYNNRMRRDVEVDKAIRCYEDVITNSNIADNRAVNANVHAVAERRYALSFTPVLSAYGASLMQIGILAYLYTARNGDIIRMTEV